MATPDFGVDVSSFPVPDTTFSTISGYKVLAQALARRLLTPRGFLTFHPNYGLDVRKYINESIDDTTLARIRSEVALELHQDERVQDANATVAFVQSTQTLLVTCKVVTASGPFSFVLSLSAVSVQLFLGDT